MRAGDWMAKPAGGAVSGWVKSIRMTSAPACIELVTDSMASEHGSSRRAQREDSRTGNAQPSCEH